jgi:large subunit ribosomal protein L1
MKHGKRFRKGAEIAGEAAVSLHDAVGRLKAAPAAKFDETCEVAIHLGVDPRHADQQVRGTVILPHGIGKSLRVLVLAKGEKEKEAREAGADHVGNDDYLAKLREGWTDIDAIVATPDMMGEVGKLGKQLGPRGLMPNPKAGTVTFDVAKAVNELKAGKIEFRVDKGANLHVPFGKKSFAENSLYENLLAFLRTVNRMKPAGAKGQYIKSVTVSSTMGPGLRVDLNLLATDLKG